MNIQVVKAASADINGAFAVIKAAFEKLVAPGYSREGILEFYKFANPLAMRLRLPENLLLAAKTDGEEIVGIIEVKNRNHVSLLFVHPAHHKKGIAKQLLSAADAACEGAALEVNSSPYAVAAYEKLGFTKLSGEQEKHGIRYVPMLKPAGPKQ